MTYFCILHYYIIPDFTCQSREYIFGILHNIFCKYIIMEIASLREGGGPLAVEGESVMKKRIRLALWESCRGATERAGRDRRLKGSLV